MSRLSAVVDRIVDGEVAVLLVGPEEVERIVPLAALPKGVREGMWLFVTFTGDELTHAEIDAAGTTEARKRITEKMRLLRERRRPRS